MTRSWTDPRTGRRWHIDVVHAHASRRRAPGSPSDPAARAGRGAGEASPALVFGGPEETYAVPTAEAARLELLEDDRLAELLDAARGGGGPQRTLRDAEGGEESREGVRIRGSGESAPSAAGRESQPHRDPAESAE